MGTRDHYPSSFSRYPQRLDPASRRDSRCLVLDCVCIAMESWRLGAKWLGCPRPNKREDGMLFLSDACATSTLGTLVLEIMKR